MSISQDSSSDGPGRSSKEGANEGSDENDPLLSSLSLRTRSLERSSSTSRSTSRSELDDSGEALSTKSPLPRELTPPDLPPAQRPQSLSLTSTTLPSLKEHTSSPVLLPLAQSTPTSSSAKLPPSAPSRAPPPESLTGLTPSTAAQPLLTCAELPANPREDLPLYMQYKKLVADARREAYEGKGRERTKRLRTRPSQTVCFLEEFSTEYKSRPYRRKKSGSGSKALLTGKQYLKGRQRERAPGSAAATSPISSTAAVGAASTSTAAAPSRTTDDTSTSKAHRSPSAGTGRSHQTRASTAATPGTSTRRQPQGGSGGKSAPARHSTTPRKDLQDAKSRRQEHEVGGKPPPVKLHQLSPCKVSLARLPSDKMLSPGSLWKSPRSEGAVAETSPRDLVTGPPAEGQRGIPLTRGLEAKRRRHPLRAIIQGTTSTGGLVKKRRGRPPLKATIPSTTSNGALVKKRRGRHSLKAAILDTTSTDRQEASTRRNVKRPVQQKASSARPGSSQKKSVSAASAHSIEKSDLTPCPQRAPKLTPQLSAQKPKKKNTAKVKVPSLDKHSFKETEAPEHRRKPSDVLCQINVDIASRAISKRRKERRRKISVATTPLKIVPTLEPTFQDMRQNVIGLPIGSLEISPEIKLTVEESSTSQMTSTVPRKAADVSPERRSTRSAALVARQAIISATVSPEDDDPGNVPTKESYGMSPSWNLSSTRNPICWPPPKSRSQGRHRKALVRRLEIIKRRILSQQDDEGPSECGTPPAVADDDSVTFVLDDMLDAVGSVNSVLHEMKERNTSEEAAECSSLPSTTPPLDEPTASVQQSQPTVCEVDTGGSISTAPNQLKMETQDLPVVQALSPAAAVKERRTRQWSLSQLDSDAAVATSPEVIAADVSMAEAEERPRSRSSPLGGGSGSPRAFCASQGRSRSCSPSIAVRSSPCYAPADDGCESQLPLDMTRASYGVLHWKKQLMRFPREHHSSGMSCDEYQSESERSTSQSAFTEHSATKLGSSSVSCNLAAGDEYSSAIPLQETPKKRCESIRENLPIQHKRVEALSSWSLKFDTSWSEHEMEILEGSGEGSKAVTTACSEPSMPEHENSNVIKQSPSSKLSLAKETASSDTALDIQYDSCTSDSTSTESSTDSLPPVRLVEEKN